MLDINNLADIFTIIVVILTFGMLPFFLVRNYLKYGSLRLPPEERGFNVRSRKRITALEKTVIELEQKIEKIEGRNATQSKQTPGSLGRPAQRRNRPGSG